MQKKYLGAIKTFLSIFLMYVIGCASVIFSILYLSTFNSGFFSENSKILTVIIVAIVSVLTTLGILFLKTDKNFIYKLTFISICIAFLILAALYFLKISGFYDKIKSVEEFRKYISSFGSLSILLFVTIQFLQVVVLPIPAFITVGAGVLLFGPFKGAVLSLIGIISGSIVAYFIGRIFGYKVTKWLVGKENLDKALKLIKGKDKIILTFMFLFPFFPDDVLCFVAGITTITPKFFIIMIFITRIISVFASSYSFNNNIIPYDTWWGILLWILFFAVTILLSVLIYKKGDKIEDYFSKKLVKHKGK